MTTPSPAAGSEDIYTQIGDVLTRLENAVEHSTVARMNGRTVNNRMVHANAITEVYYLLQAAVREALENVKIASIAELHRPLNVPTKQPWTEQAAFGMIDIFNERIDQQLNQGADHAI